MAVTLNLKIRKSNDSVQAPLSAIKAIYELKEEDAKNQLYVFFSSVKTASGKSTIHDATWLRFIVNQPLTDGDRQVQLPLSEHAAWLKLAVRVENLDDTKEGTFTLSDAQAATIWKKISDTRFKFASISPLFSDFLLDLMQAMGNRRLGALSDDDLYDEPLAHS